MKNKYDEAISEAFLKSAFEEAAAEEIAELEAMNMEIAPPTDKQRREIERELRKLTRKGSVWDWVKRTAAIIAIVISISFGLLMTQHDVRASVFDAITSFFEKYVVFAFTAGEPNADYAIGDYKITYVPGGYELNGESNIPSKLERVFSNGETELLIQMYPTPFNSVSTDSEIANAKMIDIGDMTGCFVRYDTLNLNKLVWGDEKHTFTIKSSLSEKEILKIAKNIK